MNIADLIPNNNSEKKISHFTRRSHIPLRRDFFWQIETGVVRTVTILEDGTLVTLGLWGTGDIVSPLLSKSSTYEIECITDVTVTPMAIDNHAQINEAIIRNFQQSQTLIEILHTRPVDVALLKLLTWMAKKFGRQVQKGQLIDFRLTHQEISEIMGITRVTVTRLLNSLETAEIIQRSRQKFIIMSEQVDTWHYEI